MTEDFSLQMQISICVALIAGIFTVMLGIALVQFNYLRNTSNKYFESVIETSEREFQNLTSTSKGTPTNGAEIYRVCMNMGLSFESITVNIYDGNNVLHTYSISVNDSGYTEEKMVEFVNKFVTDYSTKQFELESMRLPTTLWILECTEVGG